MITEREVLIRIAKAVSDASPDDLARIHNDLTNFDDIDGDEIKGEGENRLALMVTYS